MVVDQVRRAPRTRRATCTHPMLAVDGCLDCDLELVPVPGGRLRFHDGVPTVIVATCRHCGRSWNDAVESDVTPARPGRCPFEAEHDYPDEGRHAAVLRGLSDNLLLWEFKRRGLKPIR